MNQRRDTNCSEAQDEQEELDALLRIDCEQTALLLAYLAGKAGISPSLATWAIPEAIAVLNDRPPEQLQYLVTETTDMLHDIEAYLPRAEGLDIKPLCLEREEQERPGGLD